MRITQREKIFITIGLIFIFFTFFYLFVFLPITKKMKLMDDIAYRKEKELAEIIKLKQEYNMLNFTLKKIKSKMDNKKKNFSMISYVEEIAKKVKLRKKIVKIKPQTTPLSNRYKEQTVDIAIENLDLREVVSFLDQIEKGRGYLKIKRFHLKKRFDIPNRLNLNILLSTFEKIEQEKRR